MITTAAGLPTKMSQISDPETNSKQYIHKRTQKNPAVNESIGSISKSQINSSPSSSESASYVT